MNFVLEAYMRGAFKSARATLGACGREFFTSAL